jgi:hypothetical protein
VEVGGRRRGQAELLLKLVGVDREGKSSAHGYILSVKPGSGDCRLIIAQIF